jgi:hypothetical protein
MKTSHAVALVLLVEHLFKKHLPAFPSILIFFVYTIANHHFLKEEFKFSEKKNIPNSQSWAHFFQISGPLILVDFLLCKISIH